MGEIEFDLLFVTFPSLLTFISSTDPLTSNGTHSGITPPDDTFLAEISNDDSLMSAPFNGCVLPTLTTKFFLPYFSDSLPHVETNWNVTELPRDSSATNDLAQIFHPNAATIKAVMLINNSNKSNNSVKQRYKIIFTVPHSFQNQKKSQTNHSRKQFLRPQGIQEMCSM